jgi:hypothetical protein
MDKVLKIEATGSELLSFLGYVKEKDADRVLRRIKNDYTLLQKRHSDKGRLIVNISTYNPELTYSF